MNAAESVNYMIDYIMTEINSEAYNKYVMLDMTVILRNGFLRFDLLKFFEGVYLDDYCGMEVHLNHQDYDHFSNEKEQYLSVKDFKNIHEIDDEILVAIKERD